jgi:hypothetical protein
MIVLDSSRPTLEWLDIFTVWQFDPFHDTERIVEDLDHGSPTYYHFFLPSYWHLSLLCWPVPYFPGKDFCCKIGPNTPAIIEKLRRAHPIAACKTGVHNSVFIGLRAR